MKNDDMKTPEILRGGYYKPLILWKRIAIISLILLFLVSCLLGIVGWVNYGNRVLRKLGLAEYEMPMREQYIIRGWNKSLSDYTADIVFFGDSITCGGSWASYFEDISVCSLAVPGDGVDHALYRTEVINNLKPQKIFVMIGVNNISTADYEKIFDDEYKELIDKFKSTQAEVYIQSILPVRNPSSVSNDRIDKANAMLQEIAKTYGCTYIDLHTAFSDENQELKAEYSKDGVHINEDGYELWVSLISEFVY